MVIFSKMEKIGQYAGKGAESWIFYFLEKESTFSLDFRSIGPSVFDRARRKVVLRGKGYA